MHVWLANLQPDIQKPFFELAGQPWGCTEAADEECELFPDRQRQGSISSKYTNRIVGEGLVEVAPTNGVHSGLDRWFEEFRNLRAVRVRVWMLAR